MSMQALGSAGYEDAEALNLYLLFHYGSDQDQLPFGFGPKNSLHFPVRCVSECIDLAALPPNAQAIDLGCAVGRSCFQLAKHCKRVVGVDRSAHFIQAAKTLQSAGILKYVIHEEGGQKAHRLAVCPADVDKKSIEFRCCDVMELLKEPAQYDLVLAANLICRLDQPAAFLKQLPDMLKKNGQLILTSPYSWLEQFTARALWLKSQGKDGSVQAIKALLGERMQLQRTQELPFLMREHLRKYQWSVAQASVWRKN